MIATLQLQVDKQASALQSTQTQLALKEKLVEEQAHSVLELKSHNDKLDEKVTELNLKIEKLFNQLYGRKSERRIDGSEWPRAGRTGCSKAR